ncbi:MAG: DUF92 domain-containing protein [Gemmatimonadaceae bacterium]
MPIPPRWLTRGGRWAALVVGTAAALAGWGWVALLLGYFIVSSLLTQLGRATKAARAASVLAPTAARSATQVAANGGVFALGAMLVALGGDERAALAALGALGALAAATADTWATEVGLLWGGAPRSVLTWAPVEPGTSGGITAAGLAASAAGALAVAAAATLLLAPLGVTAAVALVAVTIGGVAGSLGDSLLGATIQARRRCDACATWTERATHRCGAPTRHASGIAWMTNDAVNLCATLIGGAAALGVAAAWR